MVDSPVRRSTLRIRPALVLVLAILAMTAGCDASVSEPATAEVDDARRVLIVHSYSDAFLWTREIGQGITQGLARRGLVRDHDYLLETFAMDTRITFTSPRQIEERANEALVAIGTFRPDLLFVTDDIALERVAVPYAEQNPGAPLPTIFAGINVDPTVYAPIVSLDQPGGSITGTLERIPYAEAFATAKRLFPDATRVVIVADGGASSEAVRASFVRDYRDRDAGPLEVLDFLRLNTFADWKRAVVEYQDKADLIAVLNFHQLRDERGSIVPARDVIEWMVAENKLPEVGLVADWAREGLLVAVGNSGLKTGAYVGALGADIINGDDPGAVPIVDPKQIDVKFNAERARTLGIELPPNELEAADAVYQTIGGQ